MDEYGHFSPFNDDINYTTMNSNALISIFHQSSHDYAHTKMTGIMIINRVDTNDSHRLKKSYPTKINFSCSAYYNFGKMS